MPPTAYFLKGCYLPHYTAYQQPAKKLPFDSYPESCVPKNGV